MKKLMILLLELFTKGTNALLDALPYFDDENPIGCETKMTMLLPANKIALMKLKLTFQINVIMLRSSTTNAAAMLSVGIWKFQIGNRKRIKSLQHVFGAAGSNTHRKKCRNSTRHGRRAILQAEGRFNIVCGDGSILGILELRLRKEDNGHESYINGLRGQTLRWITELAK